ncbi:MAG: hypothetical protein AB1393_13550 [Candidatus Edwardsbacteria bacterium]
MAFIIGVWIAAFLTLAIFSFLYKDNPFYRFAEHIYVGVSVGFTLIYFWAFDIRPMLWEPLWREHQYILLIPAGLGLLMLTRFIPSIAWISRWPISFTVGMGAGLSISAVIQGILLPQMQSTLLPLWVKENPLVSLNNLILVVGVITTISYFYFSREHKGALAKSARVGIVFIMISLGASFGYTVMARISLLIGRVHFLLADWLHLIK